MFDFEHVVHGTELPDLGRTCVDVSEAQTCDAQQEHASRSKQTHEPCVALGLAVASCGRSEKSESCEFAEGSVAVNVPTPSGHRRAGCGLIELLASVIMLIGSAVWRIASVGANMFCRCAGVGQCCSWSVSMSGDVNMAESEGLRATSERVRRPQPWNSFQIKRIFLILLLGLLCPCCVASGYRDYGLACSRSGYDLGLGRSSTGCPGTVPDYEACGRTGIYFLVWGPHAGSSRVGRQPPIEQDKRAGFSGSSTYECLECWCKCNWGCRENIWRSSIPADGKAGSFSQFGSCNKVAEIIRRAIIGMLHRCLMLSTMPSSMMDGREQLGPIVTATLRPVDMVKPHIASRKTAGKRLK